MRTSLGIFCCTLSAAAVLGTVGPVASQAQAPTAPSVEVVEKLHNMLLAVMRSAVSLGFAGRYKKLLPVVSEVYDLQRIARMTVGRHWEDFDESQRAAFVDALRRLTAATYADRFDSYGGETFTVKESRPLKPGRDLVVSLLIPSKKKDQVRFDYILERNDDHWRIINVVTAGVSEVALKRAQYSEFLDVAGHGPGDLIAKIKDLIRYRREHAEGETEKAD